MKEYELSFQKNIRDIGGLSTKDGRHIKYGKLFRGGALYKVNEDDKKIIKDFNLTDIIDFRDPEEFEGIPDYHPENVTMHNVPVLKKETRDEVRTRIKSADGNLLWFLGDHTSGFEHLVKVYREFVETKEGVHAFKTFFEIIMQDNAVTYFHCSQGKDRTGFAAYLFEIALGVSEEDAMEDYLLSNKAMAIRAEKLLQQVEYRPFYNEDYKKDLLDVFSTKVEYMESAVNAMNELYGGTLNFIEKALCVDIEKLKSIFLI